MDENNKRNLLALIFPASFFVGFIIVMTVLLLLPNVSIYSIKDKTKDLPLKKNEESIMDESRMAQIISTDDTGSMVYKFLYKRFSNDDKQKLLCFDMLEDGIVIPNIKWFYELGGLEKDYELKNVGLSAYHKCTFSFSYKLTDYNDYLLSLNVLPFCESNIDIKEMAFKYPLIYKTEQYIKNSIEYYFCKDISNSKNKIDSLYWKYSTKDTDFYIRQYINKDGINVDTTIYAQCKNYYYVLRFLNRDNKNYDENIEITTSFLDSIKIVHAYDGWEKIKDDTITLRAKFNKWDEYGYSQFSDWKEWRYNKSLG